MFNTKNLKELNTYNILLYSDQETLWRSYCSNFRSLNRPFCSELRVDKSPSCFLYSNSGKLIYKDFGSGEKFDIFGYIQRKYGISFFEALRKINHDHNLKLGYGDFESTKVFREVPKSEFFREKIRIKVKLRDWNSEDKDYWVGKYHLTGKILKDYKVFPISHYWIIKGSSEVIVTCHNMTFGYFFGNDLWKLYSPYGENKWVSNLTSDIYSGFDQLNWIGDTVIITSSLKDCMVLRLLGYDSFAPQSEAQIIQESVLISLKKRFKDIYLNLDNDFDKDQNYGQIYAAKFLKVHQNLIKGNIIVQNYKDISDMIEAEGPLNTLKFLKKCVK